MTDVKEKSTVLEKLSSTRSFDGVYQRFQHYSEVLDCKMVFGIFLPDAKRFPEPSLVWWLSGLTCTDENFMQKAGGHRIANELGLAIICPDTSPRGTDLPCEHDSYDFGSGAGFYLNATQSPWDQHYRMYDYVLNELPAVVQANFSLNGRHSIMGHSMGGHGALVLGLRNPKQYKAVSAFAPITNPTVVPWGEKAFSGYLGENTAAWKAYDACELIRNAEDASVLPELWVEQGTADNFLETQLKPENLEFICKERGVPLTLRMQDGYDHSYFFIATFIEDHLRYHAKKLA